jgi:hypothetical protein
MNRPYGRTRLGHDCRTKLWPDKTTGQPMAIENCRPMAKQDCRRGVRRGWAKLDTIAGLWRINETQIGTHTIRDVQLWCYKGRWPWLRSWSTWTIQWNDQGRKVWLTRMESNRRTFTFQQGLEDDCWTLNVYIVAQWFSLFTNITNKRVQNWI